MANEDEYLLEESKDVMISALAQTMVIYGVTPSVGRIYGLLFFADEPMTLDDIKVQVAMSKASVSNGMRELLETDMVTKVWKKGERKDHYIAEKDFLRNFINFFTKKIRQERQLILKGVEQTEDTFKYLSTNSENPEIKKEAQKNLDLIHGSMNYFHWTMKLANAMESGDIFKYFPKNN